jgi:dihydrofolate reductase
MSWRNLEVVHVVAVDQQHCIGRDNQMAWHIPADFKHFREITQGGVVVMGRKTFESIGRPLPKRVNIVLTRQTDWSADGIQITHSLEDALNVAAEVALTQEKQSIFVIGGADFYTQTLPFADRLEITHVALDVQGDAFYPPVPAEFVAVSREPQIDDSHQIHFEFVRYQRIVGESFVLLEDA